MCRGCIYRFFRGRHGLNDVVTTLSVRRRIDSRHIFLCFPFIAAYGHAIASKFEAASRGAFGRNNIMPIISRCY